MKAEELRIGNFVLYQDTNHTKSSRSKTEPIEVESVWYNGINIESGYEGAIECGIDEENIIGIPLTPEILEKCGFKRTTTIGGDWSNDGDTLVYFDNERGNLRIQGKQVFHRTFKYMELIKIDLIYLHQLQNLCFALNGEELNYKP